MEFIDDFMSDNAITTLEILTYLGDIGSHKLRDEIIYDGRRSKYSLLVLGERRDYRIFVDDITKSIINFLSNIDEQIVDAIILEMLENTDNTDNRFAKYYEWNKIKRKDDSFKTINVNVSLWRFFVETSKKNKMKLDDFFKNAIIKYLERRYNVSMEAQKLLATDIFQSSYMPNETGVSRASCGEVMRERPLTRERTAQRV